MPTIVSYNINGIRAAIRKGLAEWLDRVNPDIVCLQEIKAKPEQFDTQIFNKMGYKCYIHSANKPGYSGVAILTRITAEKVIYGCKIQDIDNEGRVLRIDYPKFSVMSIYFPSGSSGDIRQKYKMYFLQKMYNYIKKIKLNKHNLIVCGDYNICHKAIDIHNPLRNKNTSGFLPEEREWLTNFINTGFIDSFRFFDKSSGKYSWWSYRARARAKNLGWRIDYIMVTENLSSSLNKAAILSDAEHSDHCPVLLEMTD